MTEYTILAATDDGLTEFTVTAATAEEAEATLPEGAVVITISTFTEL